MIYINDEYEGIVFDNEEEGLHRINGPAIIYEKSKEWWVKGWRHRLDGPAFINEFYQEWYQNGKLHRIDGPAFININTRHWFIDGEEYTQSEYQDKLKEMGIVK